MSLEGESRDLSIIEELSGHVAAQSKNAIIHCLVRIKNDTKILDRLIKDGGIDILTKLLQYQSTKILDITLSILANAFLKSSVREKVRSKKIAHNVVWIIKNLTAGITLHCRACRLIGNMAESVVHAKALDEARVVPALGDILNSKTNTQTLTMVIRAIRNIWTAMKRSQNEILECGLVKDITIYLVLYKSKYQEDQTLFKYNELAETCLKAIRAFADTTDPRAGEQIRIKNDLRGYKCIVEYCKLGNRMSFQVLYKLSRIADHRPNLGSVGAIECTVKFLESNQANDSNLSFSGEVVVALCFFSREAVNRLRIRDTGGLEVMLKLLADVQYDTYHALLLHALTQFVFDEESIAIMINNGIVNVLVSRLKQMVLDNRLAMHEINDDNPTSRKRTADNMLSSIKAVNSNQIKHNRSNSGRYSLDLYTSEWSPRSGNSACSSPSNSSPTRYYTSDNAIDEDDNYSPVCSESENDEDTIENEKELTEFTENDKELSEIDSIMNLNETNLAHIWTLSLLSKLSFWNDPIEGLAHRTTIQALTAYIETSKNFRAPSILNRIIKNHVYFLPLLLQGFVFEVQSLENSDDYLKLLCDIAESGGAFGDLVAILLRGQESHKLMVALSVPFLLRSKDKLRILLIDYGGINLIFDLLMDEKHILNENSVFSVCQLANVLEIVPKTIVRYSFSNDNFQSNENFLSNQENKLRAYDTTKNEDIVTFELDDGETVDVCRHLLCIKSEVFYAMLEGRFFEAKQKRIRLQNVSRDGFAMLCSTAAGDFSNENYTDSQNFKIEVLLDAVLLADKFLMFEELEKLTEISLSQLSHGNLCRAWDWARSNDCHELKSYCIKNFVTSKLSRNDRVSTFRDFAANQNFREFLDDVKNIVTSKLMIRR